MRWVALSSFSGTEISMIRQFTGFNPIIGTNNKNSTLLGLGTLMSDRPTVDEYYNLFGESCDLITLHGWNRIIPDAVCNRYEIYNVHPGDIINHPELKGFNPQQKAIDLGLRKSGVVIHRCIPEVDSGEIVRFKQVDIADLDVDDVTKVLRAVSVNMWLDFLDDRINERWG